MKQQRTYLFLAFVVCFSFAALFQLRGSDNLLTSFTSDIVSHSCLTTGGITDSELELTIQQNETENERQELRIKTRIKASEIAFYPAPGFDPAYTPLVSEEHIFGICDVVLYNSLLVVSPLRGPPCIV